MPDPDVPAAGQPDPPDAATGGASARRATKEPTDQTLSDPRLTANASAIISSATPRSGPSGFAPTDSGSGSTSPTSAPSTGRSPRWRTPTNAREFASQANVVATMILNGEIELDTARVYVSAGRTAAQMLTAEVQRARYLQQEPNLSLTGYYVRGAMGATDAEGPHEHLPCTRCGLVEVTGDDDLCDECREEVNSET